MKGIRDTLNEKPAVAGVGAAVLVVLAIGVFVFSFYDFNSGFKTSDGEQAFFTVDDGKTWFKDSVKKLAPWDKDGKQAVRCHVYDAGGKKFVGWMERYTPEGKTAYTQVLEQSKTHRPDGRLVGKAMNSGREIKRPGEDKWVVAADFKILEEYSTVKAPAGVSGEPELVSP